MIKVEVKYRGKLLKLNKKTGKGVKTMAKNKVFKEGHMMYDFAQKNHLSYSITFDKLTVIDKITNGEWTYEPKGLLSNGTRNRLVYEKMKEMLEKRENPKI